MKRERLVPALLLVAMGLVIALAAAVIASAGAQDGWLAENGTGVFVSDDRDLGEKDLPQLFPF